MRSSDVVAIRFLRSRVIIRVDHPMGFMVISMEYSSGVWPRLSLRCLNYASATSIESNLSGDPGVVFSFLHIGVEALSYTR